MNDLKKLRQNQITIKCEICDKEFKNNIGLRQHIKNTHNFVKEHQCNICQKVFQLRKQLISHGNKKHHKCVLCGKTFSKEGSLKKHINTVHNGQKDHESHFQKHRILEHSYQ